jgi:selenocysteine-specific elongation factor
VKSVVVGTAGHIDHGKSALVHALTGTDPDRLKEEKARGITIDLGFAHRIINDINLAFVDVPGHERFVKNMLAGVGGVDLVLLVVAADESVMPQTREHFDICRLLRLPRGIVALTKSDLVDAETLDVVRLEVRELVARSFLAEAPVVPVSARTGQGLDELCAALAAVASSVPGRSSAGATRLPIDRVFSMKGFGTVVTGTLVAGRLRPDAELLLAPGDRRVRVRGIQVHGASCEEALAGQRAAVNLSGVEVQEVHRGETLVDDDTAEQTRLADAVLEVLPDAKPIRHAARVRLHQGTAEVPARISIIGPPRRDDAEPRAAPTLGPGMRAYVRLRFETPSVLVRGDRFIVRSYSPPRTIAGGYILDPRPPRIPIRTDAAVERCRRLDVEAIDPDREGAEARAAALMVEDAGLSGMPVTQLVSRVGVEPGRVAACVNTMVGRGAAIEIGQHLVAPQRFERLKAEIVAALTRHHRGDPLSEGLAREEARVRLSGRGHPSIFERAIEELVASRTIVGRDRLALASHHVQLPAEVERARETVARVLREAALTPPDAAALVAASGASAAIVDQVLRLLQRQKILVKLDSLLFHEDALKRLKLDVAAMKPAAGGDARIDVPAFKERFGVTRKFAIPLLEYLDRERVTRRMGDSRVIL